jgi:hypothetical protein
MKKKIPAERRDRILLFFSTGGRMFLRRYRDDFVSNSRTITDRKPSYLASFSNHATTAVPAAARAGAPLQNFCNPALLLFHAARWPLPAARRMFDLAPS